MSNNHNSHIGLIIGSSMFGIVILILILICIQTIIKKKQKRIKEQINFNVMNLKANDRLSASHIPSSIPSFPSSLPYDPNLSNTHHQASFKAYHDHQHYHRHDHQSYHHHDHHHYPEFVWQSQRETLTRQNTILPPFLPMNRLIHKQRQRLLMDTMKEDMMDRSRSSVKDQEAQWINSRSTQEFDDHIDHSLASTIVPHRNQTRDLPNNLFSTTLSKETCPPILPPSLAASDYRAPPFTPMDEEDTLMSRNRTFSYGYLDGQRRSLHRSLHDHYSHRPQLFNNYSSSFSSSGQQPLVNFGATRLASRSSYRMSPSTRSTFMSTRSFGHHRQRHQHSFFHRKFQQQNSFSNRTKLPLTSKHQYYKALKYHVPSREDELIISMNDKLVVLETFHDGWAFGHNLTTNQVGAFPLYCCS